MLCLFGLFIFGEIDVVWLVGLSMFVIKCGLFGVFLVYVLVVLCVIFVVVILILCEYVCIL